MASRRKRNLQFLPVEPRTTAALDINALPIDIGVGELMRLTRERLGQELQTVANQLRIRLGYLEAIEDGRFRDLPGSTYAVGFVRSYADYLGLDSADIVRRFREEAARIHGTTKLIFPSLTAEGKVPRAAVLLLSAVGLAAVYGGWYVLSSRNSVQLPLIAEVPDRLVALPPDEGSAPATPSGSTSSAPPPEAATPPGAMPSPAPTTGPANTAPPVEAAPPSVGTGPSITGSANAAPPAGDTPGAAPVPPSASASTPNSDAAASSSAAVPPAASAPPSNDAAGATSTAPPAASAAADAAGSADSGTPPAPPTPAESGAQGPAVAENGAIPMAPAAPSVETPAPTQEAALPAGESKGIVLEARIDSWVQVVNSSGKVVFSQILRPGERYVVPDEPGLTLDTGNAGGLDVLVDGNKAPPLGDVGAVRHRVVMDAGRLMGGTATSN